jgi:hypothetical protein
MKQKGENGELVGSQANHAAKERGKRTSDRKKAGLRKQTDEKREDRKNGEEVRDPGRADEYLRSRNHKTESSARCQLT